MRPECLALVDVADAGADSLLEQQLADRPRLRKTGAPDHLVEVEPLGEDVRTQVLDRLTVVAHDLDDRSREQDGHRIVEAEHGPRPALGLPPAFPGPVKMPGTRHPHV